MRLRGAALTAALLGSRAAAAVLGLLQLTTLTRFLSAGEFGTAALAISVATYGYILAEPAIAGYERLGAQGRGIDLAGERVRGAAQWILTITAVGVLASSVLGGLLTRGADFGLAIAVWTISLFQLRWSTVQVLNWGRPEEFAKINLLNAVVRFGCSGAVAWETGSGTLALIAGGTGSVLATAAISPGHSLQRPSTTEVRRLLRIGIPSSIPALAYTSMMAWPTVAAAHILNTNDFASFAAQFSLATALAGTTLGFLLVFGFPRVKYKWDKAAPADSIGLATTYSWQTLFISLGLAGLAFLFGEWFTSVFINPSYSGRVTLTVAMLGYGIFFLARPASWILRLEFRQNLLGGLTVVAALAQLPAVWFGTALGGVQGLLVSLVGVFALQTVLVLASGLGRRALALQLAVFVLAGLGAAVMFLADPG